MEARLASLGLRLPASVAALASYAPVVLLGGLAYVSGQLPRDEAGLVKGQVGAQLTVADAVDCARLCALNILAVLRDALGGDLDRVERCVQLTGFVYADPAFEAHSTVINGASDLMIAIFDERGRHARAAVGVASLPFGAPVEVAAIFAVHGVRA